MASGLPADPRQAAEPTPYLYPPRRRLSLWAILVGSVVDMGSTLISGAILTAIAESNLADLILGLTMTALGGYVAAAVAGHRSEAHGAGVGVLSALVALLLSRVGGADSDLPAWYTSVAYGMSMPAGALGGWARRRLRGERPAIRVGQGVYPTLRQAIWLLVVFLFVSVASAGSAIAIVSLAAGGRSSLLTWGVPGLLAGTALGYALVLMWAARKARAPAAEAYPLRRVRPKEFWPVAMTSAGFVILVFEIQSLLRSRFPPPPVPFNPLEIFGGLDSHLWAVVVYAVIIAPFAEELLFRGVILRGFLTRYTVRKAIFGSAILFGVAHLNPFDVVSATLLGVLFGWWRTKTGSLLLPVFGHALHNALVLTVLRYPLLGGMRLAGPIPGQVIQPLWFNLTGVLLCASGIVLFMRGGRSRSAGGG